MPKLNGLDLVYQLPQVDFEIIFVTAYDNYAVEAFRVNAIDYLLKPFESSHLVEAVKKVKQKLQADVEDTPLQLVDRLKASFNKISLPKSDGIEFVDPEQIVYCKSDGSYTEVITSQKRALITRTLGEMEEQLSPYSFFRTHKILLG